MFHIVLNNDGRYDHIATESARATGRGSYIKNPNYRCRRCREWEWAYTDELNEQFGGR